MTRLVYAISTVADGNMSLKYGEEMEVAAGRKRFLASYKLKLEDFVTLWVQGKDGLEVVGVGDKGRMLETDAVITKEFGVGLFMVTADCFPVILHDEKVGILGLVHLGWRGVDKELVLKVVGKMQCLGAKELRAIIGPGIRKESYVFDVPLVQENDPRWQPFLERQSGGRVAIDLAGFIKKQLVDCGVEKIEDCGIDTAKDKNYFSHYRSMKMGEQGGRFATVAMMV